MIPPGNEPSRYWKYASVLHVMPWSSKLNPTAVPMKADMTCTFGSGAHR